jgi:hypothetical protein
MRFDLIRIDGFYSRRQSMMSNVRINPTIPALVTAALVLLALACSAQAQDAPKLPPGTTEVTKEDLLTKVPSFFYFDYRGKNIPGKRLWLRVDAKHFIERYPTGHETRYKILGRMTVGEESGTVVVLVEHNHPKPDAVGSAVKPGQFQVFVPDKGNKLMAIQYRHDPRGRWSVLKKDGKPNPMEMVE